MLDREKVLAALKQVSDPVSGGDLMASGVVRALNVEQDAVRFVMEIPPSRADAMMASSRSIAAWMRAEGVIFSLAGEEGDAATWW